jgi:hypothetical protein
MAPYIVITTRYAVYKCHGYRIKAGRVYFNSRAINVANVATIVDKDGKTTYSNDVVTPYNARSLTQTARRSEAAAKKSTLKAAEKIVKAKYAKKSSLPDVIEI